MNIIYEFLPENILNALGWTVLHSLWQAFLAALLLAAYLLVWQKTDARRRYLAGCVAMGGTLLFSLITFFIVLGNGETGSALASEVLSDNGEVLGHYFIESSPSAFMDYFNENMPLIVTAWLMGMVFFFLRTLGGLLYIQRLKTRHLSSIPEQWQAIMNSLQASLGISQKIKIAASALVKVPMVVGWFKPVVLMPLAAINNLTTEQVEAILAHELAHIARYDYLVNILQAIVEAIFYFNPAVWWISARIRTERENCCDDLAVVTCGGNSLAYAKALVSLQEMQQVQPMLALSFSKNKNQLLLRIQRILQSPDKKSNAMEKISATVLLLAALILLSVQAQSSFSNPSNMEEDAFFNNEFTPEYVSLDTLPANFKNSKDGNLVIVKKNGDVIEMELDNGEIKNVKVNGEPVPEEDFAQYDPDNLPAEEIATVDISKGNHARDDHFPKGSFHFNRNEDGEDMEVRVKDGKIKYLRIDGEEIDEAEYADYQDMVEELVNDLPAPPPIPPMPPMPPAPPVPSVAPVAPMAPMPPAPPAPPVQRTRTITTEKNGQGMTIIIENDNGEEPIEIEIDNHRKGNVTINGNEIKGLKEGDRTVIKQNIDGSDDNVFFDEQRNRVFWFPNDSEHIGFAFPEADQEQALRFRELLALKEHQHQELFKGLSEREIQEMERSKRLVEELHREQEGRVQEQLERARMLNVDRDKLLAELEKRKQERFFENDQRMMQRELRLKELHQKMEAEQMAVQELMNKDEKEALAKHLKAMEKLRGEVDRLHEQAKVYGLKGYLYDEYRGAQ